MHRVLIDKPESFACTKPRSLLQISAKTLEVYYTSLQVITYDLFLFADDQAIITIFVTAEDKIRKMFLNIITIHTFSTILFPSFNFTAVFKVVCITAMINHV